MELARWPFGSDSQIALGASDYLLPNRAPGVAHICPVVVSMGLIDVLPPLGSTEIVMREPSGTGAKQALRHPEELSTRPKVNKIDAHALGLYIGAD